MIGRTTVDRILAAGRPEQTRQILANSLSLVATVTLTSGLGFVYWFLAAFTFPQAEIGFASASISAMMLVSSLATLGLGTMLIAEVPRHQGREPGLIAAAMIVAGVVGFVLGVAFALVASAASREFQALAGSPLIIGLFSVGVALSATSAVLDVALIGSLRGDLQFARAAIFALVKLLLLVSAGVALSHIEPRLTIIGTWVVGLLLSLGALSIVGLRNGKLREIRPVQFEALRLLRGSALRNHALNLSLGAPDWTMPILVTAILSAEVAGAFFIAWMIAGVALFVPGALAQVLYAVCARAPETLPKNLRLTLRLSFAVGVVIAVTTAVVGPVVLGLLGHRYIEAAPALVILALGIFPVSIKVHYVTIGRLDETMRTTTWMSGAGALIELSLAAAGGLVAGLTGVALGILTGLIIQATAMTPRIRSALRRRTPAGEIDVGATDVGSVPAEE